MRKSFLVKAMVVALATYAIMSQLVLPLGAALLKYF